MRGRPRRFGLEAPRQYLGRSEVGTTQIYAEKSLEPAREVMRQIRMRAGAGVAGRHHRIPEADPIATLGGRVSTRDYHVCASAGGPEPPSFISRAAVAGSMSPGNATL